MTEYKSEELAILRVMASIDRLLPSDRDRKLKQQSTQILNYYTVDQLQQQFGFVRCLKPLCYCYSLNLIDFK